MSKNIGRELQSIKDVLANNADGLSIDSLIGVLDIKFNRRTLQRRLLSLREQNQIYLSGKTRSTRYHLVTHALSENTPNLNITGREKGENKPFISQDDIVPLSKLGRDILSYVSAPIIERKSVQYNKRFIEKYSPNSTFYLTAVEIKKLTKLGNIHQPMQPAGTYAKDILSRLLIDLSFNSSRLEGNTYSLLDTQQLISTGEMAENKSTLESQMILNHKDAIEFLVQSVEDIGFNRYTILNLHAMLSNNLLPDPSASGRLRNIPVGIEGSVFEPLIVPQQISEIFDLILSKATAIENVYEQAFFIMVHLPYLQPFDDVNKRVSRLASNIPLIKNNVSPLSFIDVSDELYISGMLGVYETNKINLLKDIFLWAYERSAERYSTIRQSLGEPDPFRLYYRDQIRTIISRIIRSALRSNEAVSKIKNIAKDLPDSDQKKFIATVETEIMSLHEGNFARYQIRPSEFYRWKKSWP